MADLIAIAETLEAQAAALRREAARQASAGQAELALEPDAPWIDWPGGDEPPVPAGTRVDIRYRSGTVELGRPADVFNWQHGGDVVPVDPTEITAYRVSAEQPD